MGKERERNLENGMDEVMGSVIERELKVLQRVKVGKGSNGIDPYKGWENFGESASWSKWVRVNI